MLTDLRPTVGRLKASLLGGGLALLVLAGTSLPAAAAESIPAAPSATAASQSQATLDPALVGRWWAHPPKDNDCAQFCVSHDEQYQFLPDGNYLFTDQHRDQYNSGGRFCIDERLYTASGRWFTTGGDLYLTATVATAQHSNTCQPETNFRRPAPLHKSYIGYQLFRESTGGHGLVLYNPNNPSDRTVFHKTA